MRRCGVDARTWAVKSSVLVQVFASPTRDPEEYIPKDFVGFEYPDRFWMKVQLSVIFSFMHIILCSNQSCASLSDQEKCCAVSV